MAEPLFHIPAPHFWRRWNRFWHTVPSYEEERRRQEFWRRWSPVLMFGFFFSPVLVWFVWFLLSHVEWLVLLAARPRPRIRVPARRP